MYHHATALSIMYSGYYWFFENIYPIAHFSTTWNSAAAPLAHCYFTPLTTTNYYYY